MHFLCRHAVPAVVKNGAMAKLLVLYELPRFVVGYFAVIPLQIMQFGNTAFTEHRCCSFCAVISLMDKATLLLLCFVGQFQCQHISLYSTLSLLPGTGTSVTNA